MEWWMSLSLFFGGMVLLLLTGLPIAFAFLVVNMVAAYFFLGGIPGLIGVVTGVFMSITTFTLLPVPFFVLMGALIFHIGRGNPVVIPPTEVYIALERNVVDGYGWPAVGIRDWGWQKQTQYVLDPGFYQVPNPLLVNLKAWNQLPQKLKDLLNEAAIEAEKRVVASFSDLEKQERPLLLKEGIQVIDLPPAEKEKFLKVAYELAWKDVLEKCPETGPKLRELLTRKR